MRMSNPWLTGVVINLRPSRLRHGSDRPGENTGTLIEKTVESLVAHDLDQSVLSDIKKRGEGEF